MIARRAWIFKCDVMGVLNADTSLNLPVIDPPEAFQLLTQVAGRARKKEVIIQS